MSRHDNPEHQPQAQQPPEQDAASDVARIVDREPAQPRPGIWVAKSPDALSGWWCDATGTPEQVGARLAGGQVYDTVDFGAFTVRPDEKAAVIAAVANGIREHGYAFAAWAEFHDADPVILRTFTEHYLGEVTSLHQLGIELAGQEARDLVAAIPERLKPYVSVDWMRLAADEVGAGNVLLLDAPEEGFYLFRGPDSDGTQRHSAAPEADP